MKQITTAFAPMKGIAMSRRNEGSYRERNGIGSTTEHTTWTRPEAAPDVARLETELADTRAALNLARERAEDAEADLEEARLELDQFRTAPALPIRPAPTPNSDPIESPAVTAIAAELVAVMAENDRRAAATPAPAPAPAKRKRRAAKPKRPRHPFRHPDRPPYLVRYLTSVPERSPTMKIDARSNSKSLRKEDVLQPIIAIISDVRVQTFEKTARSPREDKDMLHFTDPSIKPLGLNVTNKRILIAAYGDESDLWRGQPVEIYVDSNVTNSRGEIVGGIRLRIPRTATAIGTAPGANGGSGIQADADAASPTKRRRDRPDRRRGGSDHRGHEPRPGSGQSGGVAELGRGDRRHHPGAEGGDAGRVRPSSGTPHARSGPGRAPPPGTCAGVGLAPERPAPRITNRSRDRPLFVSGTDLTIYRHKSLNALPLGFATTRIENPAVRHVTSCDVTRGCAMTAQKLRFTGERRSFCATPPHRRDRFSTCDGFPDPGPGP